MDGKVDRWMDPAMHLAKCLLRVSMYQTLFLALGFISEQNKNIFALLELGTDR